MKRVPIEVLRRIFDYCREDDDFQGAESFIEAICYYHFLEDKEKMGVGDFVEQKRPYFHFNIREEVVLQWLEDYWNRLEKQEPPQ